MLATVMGAVLAVSVCVGVGTGAERPAPTAQVQAPQQSAQQSAQQAAQEKAQRSGSCSRGGSQLWTHLRACGWAGKQNTGPYRAGCPRHRLARLGSNPQGTIRLTRAGQVLACKQVTGCISVEAPRVTLRDLAVRCTSGRRGEAANGTGVIKIEDRASARISRVRLDGMRGVHACVWHQGSAMSINRMDCAHVNDGVFSWSSGSTGGNNFTLTNSYLHDFTTRTANGHIDGYQTEGASHGQIVHNTFLMTSDDDNQSDSAVAIWNGMRDSSDITVARNLIAGGGFSVYAEDYSPSESHPGGGNTVTNISLVGNVFSRRLFPCVGYFGVWFPRGAPTDGWHRSGNQVLETKQRVDAGNPTAGAKSCT